MVNVTEAAPRDDEAAVALGCDFLREGCETFTIGAEDWLFKENALHMRRVSGAWW